MVSLFGGLVNGPMFHGTSWCFQQKFLTSHDDRKFLMLLVVLLLVVVVLLRVILE
jgi:hypothetical protein